MLADDGLGRAEAANTDPKLQIKANTNQTRIAWDMARAFQDFLRKNPPAADYALLADYGIGRTADGKPVVGGIQFVLCDRKGDWVLVDLRMTTIPTSSGSIPIRPTTVIALLLKRSRQR